MGSLLDGKLIFCWRIERGAPGIPHAKQLPCKQCGALCWCAPSTVSILAREPTAAVRCDECMLAMDPRELHELDVGDPEQNAEVKARTGYTMREIMAALMSRK